MSSARAPRGRESPPLRRALRWVARIVLGLLAVLLAAVSAVLIVLATDSGRALLLGWGVAQANGALPGTLHVERLVHAGPWAVELEGIRLADPAGEPVLTVQRLAVELRPLELLVRHVAVERLALEGLRADLRQHERADRGLRAALPASGEGEASAGADPHVSVEALSVDGASLLLPSSSSLGELEVQELAVRARLASDRHLDVDIDALSFRVSRNGAPWATLMPLRASLRGGTRTVEGQLRAELGGATLSVHGKGGWPSAGAGRAAPIDVHVALQGVTGRVLAEALGDASLSGAFEGALGLELALGGSTDALVAQGHASTAGGSVRLRAELSELERAALELSTDGLQLGRVRRGLPGAPLAAHARIGADLSNSEQRRFDAAVQNARLGAYALPELDGRAVCSSQGACTIDVAARSGASGARVAGQLRPDGRGSLALTVALRAPELSQLARWLGAERELLLRRTSRLDAAFDLERAADGTFAVSGDLEALGIGAPQVGIARGTLHVDLAGLPAAPRGTVRAALFDVELESQRLSQLRLDVSGGPERFVVRGDAAGAAERSRLALRLAVARGVDHVRLAGNARGRLAGQPVSIEIEPTRVAFTGAFETAGVRVAALGRELRVRGRLGVNDAALALDTSELELEPLSALLGLEPAWSGTAALSAKLAGALDAPVLDWTLEAKNVRAGERPPLDARSSGHLDARRGQLSVNAALTGRTERGEVPLDVALDLSSSFAGKAGWVARLGSARAALQVELRRLELAWLERWLGRELPVQGHLSGTLAAAGSRAAPKLALELEGALAARQRAGEVQLRQSLSYEDGVLAADLQVADARGPWLSFDAGLTLGAGLPRDIEGLARVAQSLPDRSQWRAHLELERRSLEELPLALPAELGGLEAAAVLDVRHAPLSEPEGELTVQLVRAASAAPLGGTCATGALDVGVTLALAGGTLGAQVIGRHDGAELLRGDGSVALALAPALGGGGVELGAVTTRWVSRGLDLGALPIVCGQVQAVVDADITVHDALGLDPRFDGVVTARGLNRGAPPALDAELVLHAERRRAEARLSLTAPGGRSELDATLPIEWTDGRLVVLEDAALVASARLRDLPVEPFLDPSGAISHASGRVSGDLRVSGPLRAPDVEGRLELHEAELTATALAQPLHGIRGRFDLRGSELVITNFEAHDGDGSVHMDGRVTLEGAGALDARVAITARDFPLRQQGQVVAKTSARARIEARMNREHSDVAVVLEDVDTWLEKVAPRKGIALEPHADFRVDGREPGVDAADAAAPARPEPHGRRTQLTLDAADHFWVKREDFAIQLSVKLRAELDDAATNIKGRVDMHRGYLDLLGRTFEIDRGSHLEFIGSGTVDPVVAIDATHEHRASGKAIKVRITGRGSAPKLAFLIDGKEASAGDVLEQLSSSRQSGGEDNMEQDAARFVAGVTAGLLATSARRELGGAVPILMVEPGETSGEGRIRAGFEVDSLVPAPLRKWITGAYVEGIFAKEGTAGQQSSTRAGVLLELYFPHQLFTTGQWGPGTTWSIDWGWQL